ncbi:MAG TPA: hypothetical protein VI541_04620 [Actinomycetota bacterium]|nr:hypothetical protein [Actinomycetota bacterium]
MAILRRILKVFLMAAGVGLLAGALAPRRQQDPDEVIALDENISEQVAASKRASKLVTARLN